MFLGYSILQLLECGIAAIIAPMVRFKDFLFGWIAYLKQGRPSTSQGDKNHQGEAANDNNQCQEKELEWETRGRPCRDWEAKNTMLEQDIKQIKTKLEILDNTIRRYTKLN